MTRSWRALLACSAAVSVTLIGSEAFAQVRAFNLPSEDAAKSIPEFARQAGVEITAPVSQLHGVKTPAIMGQQSVPAALKVLLRGTGLEVASNTGAVIVLRAGATPIPQPSAPAASAPGAQPRAAVSPEPTTVEEVVVTAQKRPESLQRVPVSVDVISGQTLVQENHNNLEELSQTTPGVHVNAGNYSSTLVIRGVGTGANNGSFDQSVAMFEDDIYHGRSLLSGATFLDLDRIEVLRGPQSTFFGNNAIAGALNIVTKKPGDQLDASARLLYGRFGQYAGEGAIGGPITDTFGVRLALAANGQRGWIQNVDTGQYAPEEDNKAGRLTLVYAPTKDLDATLKVEGSLNKRRGSIYGEPTQWANCPPPAPFDPSFGGTPGSSCADALAAGVPTGLNNDKNAGLPGQGSRLSTFEDVLTLNYHHWGHTFTSVTGYSTYDFTSNVDNSQTGNKLLTTQDPEKYHQFSQEFRVASPVGGTIEYLAGAYLQTDRVASNVEVNRFFLNGRIASNPALAPLRPYVPFAIAGRGDFTLKEDTYSVFGLLTWNITPRLKLSGGLRGSEVDKSFVGYNNYGTGTSLYGGFVPLPPAINAFAAGIYGPVGSQAFRRSDHAWMPSARIQYQVTPTAMAYFSYSNGFKAGGFNGQNPLQMPQNVAFGPEHVDAYELGLKSKWFENRVLVNIDVFRSDYTGLQANAEVYDPINQVHNLFVKNAASSVSQGAELEAEWAVSRAFRLAANVTYLDAHYVKYPNATPGTLQQYCSGNYVLPYCSIYPNPVPDLTDLSGKPTAYAPKWSGSIVASYSVDLPRDFRLTAELTPYLTTSYNIMGGNDPFSEVRGYARLDGRLTLDSPDHRYAVDLIGKNLTDAVIASFPNDTYKVGKEAPWSIAVQLRFRLGH